MTPEVESHSSSAVMSSSTTPSSLATAQQTEERQEPFVPPPLPKPFSNSTPGPTLLAHGAEALLYRTIFLTPNQICVLKHRPRKSWRHPILDIRLTKHRILSEARILVRARREGVPVPAVLALDAEAGWLCTEFIGSVHGLDGRGLTVREALERWWKVTSKCAEGGQVQASESWVEVRTLLKKIGEAVGGLHRVGFVHGDLTSSNLMLRSTLNDEETTTEHKNLPPGNDSGEVHDNISLVGQVVLIDFGLASMSTQEEDRAVDLYVLERAMGSTHPWLEEEFGLMIDGYRGSYKGANSTLKKLEDVRMRGRKRSMLG